MQRTSRAETVAQVLGKEQGRRREQGNHLEGNGAGGRVQPGSSILNRLLER